MKTRTNIFRFEGDFGEILFFLALDNGKHEFPTSFFAKKEFIGKNASKRLHDLKEHGILLSRKRADGNFLYQRNPNCSLNFDFFKKEIEATVFIIDENDKKEIEKKEEFMKQEAERNNKEEEVNKKKEVATAILLILATIIVVTACFI